MRLFPRDSWYQLPHLMLVRQILRGLLVPTGHPERPTFVQLKNPGSRELSTTQKHLCDHTVSLGSPTELCSATMAVRCLNCAISSITNNNLSNARLEPPRKRHKSLLVHSTWDARGEEESSLRDAACLEYRSMRSQTL